jgi:hypothetical protein
VAAVLERARLRAAAANAHRVEGFDFSSTRAFDRANGYRSQSLLTIPLKSPAGRIMGVLRLINAQEPGGRCIVPFGPSARRQVEKHVAEITGTDFFQELRGKAAQLRQRREQD